MHPTKRLAQALLNAYALARERQHRLTELTIQDWEALHLLLDSNCGLSLGGILHSFSASA